MEEQKELWDNELKRTFFGKVPVPYTWFTHEHAEKVRDAFLRQKDKTVYTANYVMLIKDMGEALVPSIKKLKGAISKLDLKQYQYQNKVLFTSLYLEAIQDMEKGTMHSKIDLGHFLRTFIQTITEIYGVEVLENQQAFLALIDKHEKEQRQKLNEYNELIALIMKPTEDNPYPMWLHSPQQLNDISLQLSIRGFTDKEGFKEAFSKFLPKTSCKWKKNKTSFLFLIGLAYNEHIALPEPLLAFIVEHFTFKKGKSTNEILDKQFQQIRGKFTAPDNELPKQLLEIKSIYRAVFPKK